MGFAVEPLEVLDGGPGGSEGGGESGDGRACRPRRMALRSSSLSRGRPRRCTSYSRRSLDVWSCSLRSSSALFSC